MESLEEGSWLLLAPLTCKSSVENGHPVSDGERSAVHLDAIEEGSWSSRDGSGSAKLPHLTELALSVVKVVVSIVAELEVSLVETELVSDLFGPLVDELILGCLSFGEYSWLLLKAVVFVLIDQAAGGGVSHAVVNEVWHELVHLPGVEVVWQRE